MGPTLNVAVIGVGYWGANYLRLLCELPQVNRVVGCDIRLKAFDAVSQRFPIVEIVDSIDSLDGVDAAIVCTPAATHHAVAMHLLDAGIHVLVEKPFTQTSADAVDLMRHADARGLTVGVGHTFLHNPAVKIMQNLLDTGRIGDLYYMYARRTNLGPIRSDVNALWDLAPHDISVFNRLLGCPPVSVSAVGHRALRSNREDVGFITLTYPGNVVAHIHVSWADPSKVREMVLVGRRCRVVFDDLDVTERIRIYEKGVEPVPVEGSSFAEHALQITDGDIISPHIPWSEPLRDQVVDFLDAVLERRDPLSSARDGLDVVRVMEAIDLSVASIGAPILVEGNGVAVGEGGTVIDLVRSRGSTDMSQSATAGAGS